MKQLLFQSKITLIETNNDINFPSYYQEKPTTLQIHQNIIDSDNNSYSQGVWNITADSFITINNVLVVRLYSVSNSFQFSINDSEFFTTYEFSYNNILAPIKLTVKGITINYFYLNG